MKHLFPSKAKSATPVQASPQMETMQDVIDYIGVHGPVHLAAPLKTLRKNLFGAAPSTLRVDTKDGGQIPPQSISPLATFADIARLAGIEPCDLANPDATDQIEAVLQIKTDRRKVRDAQKGAVTASVPFLPILLMGCTGCFTQQVRLSL